MEENFYIVRFINKESQDKWCLVRARKDMKEHEIVGLVDKEPFVSYVFGITLIEDFELYIDYTGK